MRVLSVVVCVLSLLVAPAWAAGAGGGEPGGEERFMFNELRVPLADSDPVRIMAVQLMLVMHSPEAKSAVRSRQKELMPVLASALSKLPTHVATKPGGIAEVKKAAAQALETAGIGGVDEVLVQKYLVW